MTSLPAWFGGKSTLTGGSQVVKVNNTFDLLKAEASMVGPGSTWKLFPNTPAGEKAAQVFAGVAAPGIVADNPAAAVKGSAAAAANAAKNALTGGNATGWEAWVQRIAYCVLGTVLVGTGLSKITGSQNVITRTLKTGAKAAVVA
jgi:hypothetical protein